MEIENFASKYQVPVAKNMLLQLQNGVVMNLQLKKGQIIPNHVAPCEAIIICVDGLVKFRSGSNEETLQPGVIVKLDIEDDHGFEALENSSIVILKINGKMSCSH